MSEVSITGIDVQLKAIRVGTKQVTKQVWNQFPYGPFNDTDTLLGWVNVDTYVGSVSTTVNVLYVRDGQPRRSSIVVSSLDDIDLPQLFIGV